MITLERGPSTEYGTFGKLLINYIPCYVTLERPSTGDHPCIPVGTYECNRFNSPHNGDCYLLMNVPGRSMIEIHSANLSSQLLGCIAPGKVKGDLKGIPAVLESKLALQELFKRLGDKFTLEIKDGYN